MVSKIDYELLMKQYEDVLDLAFRQEILNQQLYEERNLLIMDNQILQETIVFLEGETITISEVN